MRAALTLPAFAMPAPDEFRRLLARAKAGDPAAFDQIMLQHASLVSRTALRLLGNAADAQDAAQEVFLRLHRALPTFVEEAAFPPWLYRMTVNICYDHQRQRQRRSTLTLADAGPQASISANPEQQVSQQQQWSLFQQALGHLGEKERAALVLRDLEGLSTAEVALILQSTEATVRSQISSARLKLRRVIEELTRRRP